MKWIPPIICIFIFPGVALAGPTTAERKSQFEKALSLIMSSSTPGVPASGRDDTIRDYLATKPNKGQAVQLEGHYWRSGAHEDQTAAGDRTLEGCQLRYAKPCALLAVNEEIAPEGELTPKDMPRLHYKGEFDLAQIPIIRSAVRTRADLQGYAAAANPKAIAIHPWGKIFIATGINNPILAQSVALSKCNADPERKSRDGNCFVYAVNNDVILPERRMIPR
jgi:hypothetical protein